MIPRYWETPKLLPVAQEIQAEERAREEAKLKRRMRHSQKTE